VSAVPDSDLCTDPALRDVPEGEGHKILDGRYVLFEVLGRGGMGVVYRAYHLGLGVEVAIKCLDPALARGDGQLVERLQREARAAARVKNLHVVAVQDVSEASGLHYIVMEYVAGENARQRVQRKGRLDVNEALTIVLGAAEGLAAAHRAGLVHRDVKPDNILVSSRGEVKVADLGLAKIANDAGVTVTGVGMGTPKYMPPEQFEDAKQVGTGADVYALGATLYFLLVGSDGITGKTPAEVMRRVCDREFPKVSERVPEVPVALDAFIARCVHKSPGQRPPDGDALRVELATIARELGPGCPASLADDTAESTLLGLSSVAPPPEQTLVAIQASVAAGELTLAPAAVDTPLSSASALKQPAARPAAARATEPGPPPTGPGQNHSRSAGLLLLVLVAVLAWWFREPLAEFLIEPAPASSGEAPVVIHLTEPEVLGGEWLTSERSVQLLGQVEGAAEQRVRLELDGVVSEYRLQEDGGFSIAVPLGSDRSHRLGLMADGMSQPLAFVVTQDQTPPAMSLLAPTLERRRVSSERVDLEVSVVDPHLDLVTWGTRILQLNEAGHWVAKGLSLDREGANTFNVQAADLAGNRSSLEVIIDRDTAGPLVRSVQPPEGAQVFLGTEVELTVQANEALSAALLDGRPLTVNGTMARGLMQLPGQEGEWPLTLQLIDSLDNQTTIAWAYQAVHDRVGPSITVVSPMPAQRRVRTEVFDLRVRVEDAHLSAVTVGERKLQQDGEGHWVARGIPLPLEGENVLTVRARDRFDQWSSLALTMVRDTRAPSIVAVDPPPGSRFYGAELATVTVTVDDKRAAVRWQGEGLPMDGPVATLRLPVPETQGAWNLELQCCDVAGNCETRTIEYVVVQAPPAHAWQLGQPAPQIGGFKSVGANAAGYPEYTRSLGGGVTMAFVLLPAGSFTMGSSPGEDGRDGDEGPQRVVTLDAFLMARTECTQRQWRAVMGDNPAEFSRSGLGAPVDHVSWEDIQRFEEKTGLSLPSEAQWEYAARAGTAGARHGALKSTAWFEGNSKARTHNVATRDSNAFGLYDMIGNVYEWCEDPWHWTYTDAVSDGSAWLKGDSPERVLRGGAWNDSADSCRSANRVRNDPGLRYGNLGFRAAWPLR